MNLPNQHMEKTQTIPNHVFKKFLPWIERAAISLLIVAMIMALLKIPADEMIMVSMGTLSVVFFMNARSMTAPEPKEGEQSGFRELFGFVILPKILWLGASVSVIGILFFILELSGYAEMLMVGGSSLTIGTLILVILISTGSQNLLPVYKPVLVRVLPVMAVALYILLTNLTA